MLCHIEHLSLGAWLVGVPQLAAHVGRGVERPRAADAAQTRGWRYSLKRLSWRPLAAGTKGAKAPQAASLRRIC